MCNLTDMARGRPYGYVPTPFLTDSDRQRTTRKVSRLHGNPVFANDAQTHMRRDGLMWGEDVARECASDLSQAPAALLGRPDGCDLVFLLGHNRQRSARDV